MGSEGLALGSSLTTVTLPWSPIFFGSGTRPVDARGNDVESSVEKRNDAVTTGEFCRLASGRGRERERDR